MSNYSSQMNIEQQAVTRAYARLDSLREQTRTRLDAVRAAGSHGSPTMRTERDSFATMYEDQLTALRAVEDRLVFGRIDNTDGQQRYIGRIGLSSETHEPLLTDWRAEAARPFYEATPAAHGNTVMRRHITLKFRDVVSIEDEVLDVHSTQVGDAQRSGTLTGEGALLASLNSKRTGKMTDIVATIQGEQDRIIRSPLEGAVVVQGGPGTGKTAVALHRAAYLLYTYRRKLQSSGVLVVGPSNAFLHYIDQVLPSLGETGVVSRTLSDLIPGIQTTVRDSPEVARIKGRKHMASAIANAVAARERIPEQLPSVTVNGFTVRMTRADLEQALGDAKRTRKPHNQARETFVRSALHALRHRYIEQLDYEPGHDEIADVDGQIKLDDRVRRTLNLAWLPMTGTWLVDQMFAKPEQLRRFAPWLSEHEIQLLTRPKGSPFTISDIPLLDEAMELLGPDPKQAAAQAARDAKRREEEQFAKDTLAQSGIGSGIVTSSMLLDNINGLDDEELAQKAGADREWTYGHVVVDEAQELTAMDWRMLVRRCPSRSFTIVGDVAQTSALGGTRRWESSMNAIFGQDGWDLNELTINYRNPQEISEQASTFARREGLYISTTQAVRHVPDAAEQHNYRDETSLIAELPDVVAQLSEQYIADDGTGRVAVIAPSALLETIHTALTEASAINQQQLKNEQIHICDAQTVKGLEYDAVVLVQPAGIEEEAPSRLSAAADLYVAMTRPTQRLVTMQTEENSRD